jgi:hypothetical protein
VEVGVFRFGVGGVGGVSVLVVLLHTDALMPVMMFFDLLSSLERCPRTLCLFSVYDT